MVKNLVQIKQKALRISAFLYISLVIKEIIIKFATFFFEMKRMYLFFIYYDTKGRLGTTVQDYWLAEVSIDYYDCIYTQQGLG